MSNTAWYEYAATSNRLRQTYITGFLDVSGGNMIVRGGNFNVDGIITQNTDQNYPNISYVNYSLSDLDLRYLRIENPSFSPTTNFNFKNDVSMNTKLSVVGDVSFGSRLLLGGDASLNSRLNELYNSLRPSKILYFIVSNLYASTFYIDIIFFYQM